jgi:lipopolysaccharide transport system ATP-binding protein
MSSIVIKAENIGKMYTIGHQAERGGYTSLRDVLMQNARTLWIKTKDLARGNPIIQGDTMEEFWALDDVNFEISRGETVGIIGRNGAGKSTLLKILSRITEPSTGRVIIKGRVASLLEVGTGFNPELTGRENIYLNGTILGMTRKEIKQKFDEIVAFAEVEKYLDTPVKRYSSGMYVRLAFAVAAHLEPEILVVDEVLAVGDAAFQEKCLGKMGTVAKEGRTVLFVSHNMQAVRMLCPRCVLIEKGKVIADSNTDIVLKTYMDGMRKIEVNEETGIANESIRRGGGTIRFTSVAVEDVSGQGCFIFNMGDTIRFRLSYITYDNMIGIAVYIALRSGFTKAIVTNVRHVITSQNLNAGTKGTVIIDLPDVYIRPGQYPIYIHISENNPTNINFDLLDDLTHPIIIMPSGDYKYNNFDPKQPMGYFSIPSKLVMSELSPPE